MHELPFPGEVFQRQVHYFQARVLAGECAPRLDRLAQAHVQALDGVGGVDDLAYLRRKLKKRDDSQSVSAPHRADRGKAAVPLQRECFQLPLRLLRRRGPVNELQVGSHQLAFLPAHITQTAPHHVYDA